MAAAQDLEQLRYPVGRFELEASVTPERRVRWIDEIAALPANLHAAVDGLAEQQLDTPYRDGGWTVRQVVHHVADSHMNAYVRLKLALTERAPAIKAYEEQLWAELPDSALPVQVSLGLIDALHRRWVTLMRSMRDETFARTWLHPEHGVRDLDFLLQLYAWHSRHHVAHVNALRARRGWG